MEKNKNRTDKQFSDWQFWPFIAILVAWGLTFLLFIWDDMAAQGQFGDMFGAVNALFSGFAFWGLIITIRQQREDLRLQSTELKETKEEFRNQNFQTTFFNLLRTQREMINEFSLNLFFLDNHGRATSRKTEGRALFRASKKELRKIAEALELESYQSYSAERIEYYISVPTGSQEDAERLGEYIQTENKYYTLYHYGIDEDRFNAYKQLREEQTTEKLKFIYERFFRKNEYAIGHYFRHFYHLLLFLDKSEKQQLNSIADDREREVKSAQISNDFREYVDFIKAQVDIPELVLLFYNSMNYDKAKHLLIKYQIFDVLYVGNLIRESHNVIPEYNLIKN